MMKRNIYKTLKNWKREANHRPLLVRGARQTGKTFIINTFGNKEFQFFVTINFERNPEFKDIFTTYNPREIIERIALYTGKSVIPARTLLFFDEIQECPKAIMALRYFYEEMPELHVIGAGSLLEFALKTEDFRMPVGRVQYLYMYPLSFGEFMNAIGEGQLYNHILNFSNISRLPAGLHNKLIELVRKYFILGGMPAVLNEYVQSHDVLKCQQIQNLINETYIDDFSKYARDSKFKYLKKVFSAVPSMIGQKFIYSKVDKTVKSRDFKEAFNLLETAGVIYRIARTSGAGLPLEAGVKENFFKPMFLDVGLMHAINGIYNESVRGKNLTSIFKGMVAEQFVGQELIATQSPFLKPKLYYWAREAKNSNAEIDYLIEKKSEIIPIEVKSGSSGKMKSMNMFLEAYGTENGIKVSQAKLIEGQALTSLPLYAIESYIALKNK